jgi:hypothetical protein
MIFVEAIKGFDPDHLFYNHIVAVGLNPSLINTLIFGEEEGDSHDPNVKEVDRNHSHMKTIISTTESHKERGKHSNENNVESFIVSQRIVLQGKPSAESDPTTKKSEK